MRNSETDRWLWVDTAKGIGISLVVVGHSLGGLIDAGLSPSPDWFRPVLFAIYQFHMPLFFFLSGMFVEKQLSEDRVGFLRKLMLFVAWPYVLWSSLQLLVIAWAGDWVNSPISFSWYLLTQLPVHSPSQFWFLHCLLILHFFSWCLLRAFGWWALALLSLVGAVWAEGWDLPGVLRMPGLMGPSYVLGILFGRLPSRYLKEKPPIFAILGAGTTLPVVLALSTLAIPAWNENTWAKASAVEIAESAWGLPGFAISSFLVFCICVLAHSIVGRAKWLEVIGRESLPIYLMHVFFVAGTRILFEQFTEIRDPIVLFLTGVSLGVLGPLLLASVFRTLRVSRWLGIK